MSRPDGQAPGEAFFKASLSKWSQHRDTIPAPWHTAAIDLDVAFMEARLRFQRIAPDPAPALAVRWGVARTTAWRRTRHMLAGPETACNDVQPAATAEVLTVHVLADECNSDATACNQGATEPSTTATLPLFSEPVEREGEGDKNTIMPAKAGQKVAADLWEQMEDERQRHAPGKRLAFEPRQDEVAAALRNIAATAKELGVTPSEAIMMGWRWWWQGPNPWWRSNIKPATAPETFLRKKHNRDIVRSAAAWEAERCTSTDVAPPAPKPQTPGEVAWDRWMQGLDVARAWYAANKGTREGDAFHAAMEAACKPNPIAELFGGYMDNPKEKRLVREVFVSEYERRTVPLRLVAR